MNIKILHLGKYYPPKYGGIETVSKQIVEHSGKDFFNTIIFFGKKNKKEKHSNFKKIETKTLFKIFSQPFSFNYIIETISQIKYHDLIHLHCPNILAYLAIILSFIFNKNHKKKLIIHWHSDIINQKFLYIFIKPIETLILKKATRIISSSEEYLVSSNAISKYFYKTIIVPYGSEINNQIASGTFKNKINKICKNKKIVLSVGRNVIYKGYIYLIESLEYLDKDTIIIIAGNNFKNIKNSINDKRLFIFENLSSGEINYLFSISDLFCLPSISRAEAFGIVLIEALSHKLPLITTDIKGSGINSVNIKNVTGLICRKENSIELAKSINYIFKNPNVKKQFSMNSYKRYLTNFKSILFIKKIEMLYKNEIKAKV